MLLDSTAIVCDFNGMVWYLNAMLWCMVYVVKVMLKLSV